MIGKALKKHLASAIESDAQPKKRKEDYPGYWLLIARDVLEAGQYEHLIRKLNISNFEARNYRFLFLVDVFYIHAKEQNDPPYHPNCKCDMPEQEDKQP